MTIVEIANISNPESIIKATQAAVIMSMEDAVNGIKGVMGSKIPGLTWDQLQMLFDEFKKKSPRVLYEKDCSTELQ